MRLRTLTQRRTVAPATVPQVYLTYISAYGGPQYLDVHFRLRRSMRILRCRGSVYCFAFGGFLPPTLLPRPANSSTDSDAVGSTATGGGGSTGSAARLRLASLILPSVGPIFYLQPHRQPTSTAACGTLSCAGRLHWALPPELLTPSLAWLIIQYKSGSAGSVSRHSRGIPLTSYTVI